MKEASEDFKVVIDFELSAKRLDKKDFFGKVSLIKMMAHMAFYIHCLVTHMHTQLHMQLMCVQKCSQIHMLRYTKCRIMET